MIFGHVPPFLGMKANPAMIVDEILGEIRERSFAGIFCAMLERHARQNSKPRWAEKPPEQRILHRSGRRRLSECRSSSI